jgi:hypothetical protein
MAGNKGSRMRAATLAAAAAATLVVAAGCGGAEGASRDPATRAFCDEYTGYQDRFSAGASYEDVLDALRALDPPAEIAEDFSALARAVEALTTVDTSNPEAVAEFQESTSADAQEANANILEYVATECAGEDEAAGIVPSESGG